MKPSNINILTPKHTFNIRSIKAPNSILPSCASSYFFSEFNKTKKIELKAATKHHQGIDDANWKAWKLPYEITLLILLSSGAKTIPLKLSVFFSNSQ